MKIMGIFLRTITRLKSAGVGRGGAALATTANKQKEFGAGLSWFLVSFRHLSKEVRKYLDKNAERKNSTTSHPVVLFFLVFLFSRKVMWSHAHDLVRGHKTCADVQCSNRADRVEEYLSAAAIICSINVWRRSRTSGYAKKYGNCCSSITNTNLLLNTKTKNKERCFTMIRSVTNELW